MKYQINELFRDALRPLTEKELKLLEENVLADGEILSTILYRIPNEGDAEIVDGHHRLDIYEKHCDVLNQPKFVEVVELSGATDEEVIAWIRRHQVGRRNDSALVAAYQAGKLYQDAKREARDNGSPHGVTIESFAEENDLTKDQLKHSIAVAKKVDQYEEEQPGFLEEAVDIPVSRILNSETPGEVFDSVEQPERNSLADFGKLKKQIELSKKLIKKIGESFPDIVTHPGRIANHLRSLTVEIEDWENECINCMED